MIKKIILWLTNFLSDEEDPNEPRYDPVHIGMVVVVSIFAIAVIFWLLWCLLVFGGGIQAKISPVFQLLLGAKTAAELGYAGYPYAMGAFEGWPTNTIALLILLAVVAGVCILLRKPVRAKGNISNEDKV